MKYSKTTLKELSTRYRIVLMKCFMLNAILIAGGLFLTPSPAAAGNWENGVYQISSDETVKQDVFPTEKLLITGGNVLVTNDAEITAPDTQEKQIAASISGENTKLTINEGAGIYGGQVDFSAKELNLSDGGWLQATEKMDITGGTITMNGGDFGADDEKGGIETLTVSDATVNSNTGDNMIYGDTISIGGNSQINVNKNSKFTVLTSLPSDEDETDTSSETGTLTLKDDATINLSGTLIGDIAATGGRLNALTKTAIVDGDVRIGNKAVIDVDTNTLNATSISIEKGGSLNFRISGKDNYGSVKADSISIAENGTSLNLTLDSGVLKKDERMVATILNSDNITGSFETLSQNNRYEFNKIDGTNDTFEIIGKTTAADIIVETGGNENDQKTADAWLDQGSFQEGSVAQDVANHLENLAQHNEKKFTEAIKNLQPDTASTRHTTATAINGKLADIVAGRMNNAPRFSGAGHMRGNRGYGYRGRNGGDTTMFPSSVWVQGLYNKSKLDTETGFDGKTYGFAAGIDGSVNDNLKIGIGYAYTNSDIDAIGRTTDVDSHTAILYGQYDFGKNYVNMVATYGFSQYDENKNVSGMNVSADYDMDALFTQLTVGQNLKYGYYTVSPETGLRYLWTKTHGYTDTAEQHVSGHSGDTLTGLLGVNVSTYTGLVGLDGVTFKPEAKLTATYDLMNDKGGSVVSLANGSSYTVEGETLERFGIEAGIGLTMRTGEIDTSLSYEGRFKKDYTDHTGMIKMKYNF